MKLETKMKKIKKEYQKYYSDYVKLADKYKPLINDKGNACSRMENMIKEEIISMFSEGIPGYPYIKYTEDIDIKGDINLTFGKKKHDEYKWNVFDELIPFPHIKQSFWELTKDKPEAEHIKIMLAEYYRKNAEGVGLCKEFNFKVSDKIFTTMNGILKKNISSRVHFHKPVNNNIFHIYWHNTENSHMELYCYHVDKNVIPEHVWEFV